MDEHGIVCQWGNSGDVRQVMGRVPMDESVWESTKMQLVSDGFVEEDSVVAGFMNGPDPLDDSYPDRGFAHRNGILYYTSYSKFFPWFQSFQD